MGVGLLTALVATQKRFVARVDVTVFLAVAAVGEALIATHELTLERFLACWSCGWDRWMGCGMMGGREKWMGWKDG